MIKGRIMNKMGKKFILMGFLLIVISLTLFIYNKYEDKNAGIESASVLDTIKKNLETYDTEFMSQSYEMQTVNIDGYDYIGTITIPSLNIELPVMSEYDYDRLKKAPCRYYGSVYTNDLILCAHSYKTHFKYIGKLESKDLIIFTDVKGINYIYEVVEIEILEPTEVSEMINNEFDLTLYTCTSDSQKRITVRCNRVTSI